MFKLAMNKDIIELKAQHRDHWLTEEDYAMNKVRDPNWTYTEDLQWGLKQLGNLFCWDQILQHGGSKILEVGAGFDLSFDRRLGEEKEFWIADSTGFYAIELIEEANRRRGAKFVDTLLGLFNEDLPDDYFDVVFSVSVLEHGTNENFPFVCKDMYRVLKSGGICVHSIDVMACYTEAQGNLYYNTLCNAGFQIDGGLGEIRWLISPDGGMSIFTEPLSTVFTYYRGPSAEPWNNPAMPQSPFGTFLIVAKKP